MEDSLDYADFVELVALKSLDSKQSSPFGDGAEQALFDILQDR